MRPVTEEDMDADILPSVESECESRSGSDECGSDESGSDECGSDHESESDESVSDAPPTPPPRGLKRGRDPEASEQDAGSTPTKKSRCGRGSETPVVNPYLELIAREKARIELVAREQARSELIDRGQARSVAIRARTCHCFDFVG